MKLPSTKTAAALIMLLLLIAIIPLGIAMEWVDHTGFNVGVRELKWESTAEHNIHDAAAAPAREWSTVYERTARLRPPAGMTSAWLRFSLPRTEANSAILIDRVYGNNLEAYVNNRLIYDSGEITNYSGNKVMIPLSGQDSAKELYLWSSGGSKGFGIEGVIRVGSYDKLLSFYVKQDLVDLIIGAAFLFMGGALMICLLFLKPELVSGGFFLILVILSFGVLLITYSPFLPILMRSHERLSGICFDVALFTLLPAFTIYFEQLFGPGKRGRTRQFRNLQLAYSLFCLGALVLNAVLSFKLDELYSFISINVISLLMIAQLLYLLYLSLSYARKGNKDAVIFSIGFTVFAVLSLSELTFYYLSEERYHLYWWKWGMVLLIISLIVILGRRFAGSHEQAVEYSMELEKFNNDLQRSEKMEIISELAASVAHEVRNPLQVTRGFLQILGERSGSKRRNICKWPWRSWTALR